MESPQFDASAQSSKRVHAILAVALVSQVGCWVFTSPGSALSNSNENLAAALFTVLVTIICFVIVPVIACFLLEVDLPKLGLRIGDWKSGLVFLSIAVPLTAAGLYVGCSDPAIMNEYPWAGEWLAQSLNHMLIWFSIYLLYYLAFEFFYRGFLLRALELEIGLSAAMWIQIIMSVMIHFGKPTPELIASIPAGFFFGWLVLKTRSIYYAVGIHFAIGVFNDLFAMYHKGWF